MPSLYIVSTPIGNLEDITLRALRILKEAYLIAAEDTRTTRKLLARYDIHTSLTSYHEHNKLQKIPAIIESLKEGDVALVSDAGTPGISDPGIELVQAAISNGFTVSPIPGPSAVITALGVAGIPANNFLFLGFLPRSKGQRHKILLPVSELPYTLVLFEAPHRLQQTLADLYDTLGDRTVVAVREATKIHEEVFRGTVSQCQAHFNQPRGEFTLVIDTKLLPKKYSNLEAEDKLRSLVRDGASSREARNHVAAETGLSRRHVYKMWLDIKNSPPDS